MVENLQMRTFIIAALGLLAIGVLASLLVFGAGFDLLPDLNPLPTTEATPGAGEPTSTAARIAARDQLIVGVRSNAKPFGALNEKGELIGFDVDLAREFARRWLGSEEKLRLVSVGTSDRIPQLVAGEVDLLIAAMPEKRERDALIDFSQTYFMGGPTFLVPEASSVTTLADLHDQRVGVIQGSNTSDVLLAVTGKQGITLQIEPFPEYEVALAALRNGQVSALAADSVALTQLATLNPGLRLLERRLAPEPYSIGVAQGDSAFTELVNFTLQDMKTEGVYDRLYQRWFPGDRPYALELSPGQPAAPLTQQPNAPALPPPTTLAAILQRGRLVVGIQPDFAPFSFRESNGQQVGFDLDLVREFALRWLGNRDAIDFVAAEPAVLVEQLAAGKIDLIAAALGQQREWAAQVDFSQSYLGPPIVTMPLSIGLPQNDASLRELVNVTLQEMKSDGAYDATFTRWFGPDLAQYDLAITPGDASYLLLPFQDRATPPRVSAAAISTIDRIRRRDNRLSVGVALDRAPFGFLDEQGQIAGFDVDLLQAVAQEWGVDVQLVPVTPADRIAKLSSGEVDVLAAALARRKDQAAELDFSQTYFLSGMNLLAVANAGIYGLQNLNQRAVGVLEQSPAAEQMAAYAAAHQVAVEIHTYPSAQLLGEALRSGEVLAVLVNHEVTAQLARLDLALTQIAEPLAGTPYGLGLPADDSYFNNLVNITLQTLKQRGVYDQLYQKWFGPAMIPYDLEIFPGFWPYSFAQSPVTLDKPVRSKVDEIWARRKLIAGVAFDFKPFGYLDDQNQPTGFDIELVREFAKRWLGDSNAVEWLPVTAANRLQMLAAGDVDLLAAAMPHQREWDELIDFSQTYFMDGQGLLVQADTGVNSLPDLNNKVVAAIEGSAAMGNLQALAQSKSLNIELLPFQEYPQALAALKAGQVAALTATNSALTHFAQEDAALVVLGDRLANEPYGLGIPNYDSRFQDLVNFTLQEMKADGTYDRLYQQWFSNSPPFAIEIWPEQSYFDLELSPMVRVPASEFVRGNADGFPDERPAQLIALNEFYIDQYEVTNRRYAACVQAGYCTQPGSPRSVNFANYYADPAFANYPVIWVSWEDASAYCAFHGKRLPTEAEWERAARGPEGFLFPWGNIEPTTQANYNYAASDVTAVGSYPDDRSGYGAYDMAGNVREWVADWYQWDYYTAAPADNPQGPTDGVTKVLRGGSWNDVATYLRSTARKNFLRESIDSNLGFRCAASTFPP